MTRTLLVALSTASLVALVGCESIAQHSGAIVDAGECEGSPYDKSVDVDTGSVEEFELSGEAVDGDIVLHLDNLVANCCPSPGADVAFDGFSVTVDFQDVTDDMACDCICVTDFTVTIEDVDPGTYTVDVSHDGSALGSVEIEV